MWRGTGLVSVEGYCGASLSAAALNYVACFVQGLAQVVYPALLVADQSRR